MRSFSDQLLEEAAPKKQLKYLIGMSVLNTIVNIAIIVYLFKDQF